MLDEKNAALAVVEAKHKVVIDKLNSDRAEVRTKSTVEAQRLESAVNATCRIILVNFLTIRFQILVCCMS